MGGQRSLPSLCRRSDVTAGGVAGSSGREEWAWVDVGGLLYFPSTRASQCRIINRGNQTKHVIVHAGAKCMCVCDTCY